VRPTLRVRPSIDGDGTRAADGMDRGCYPRLSHKVSACRSPQDVAPRRLRA
jgi:hypothetical protein